MRGITKAQIRGIKQLKTDVIIKLTSTNFGEHRVIGVSAEFHTKKEHSGPVMVHGRWTCSVKCDDLLEQTDITLKFASPCIIRQFKQITNQMQQFLQFIILTFIYSSTCFWRPHAHPQELNNCSSSLWFYLRSVVIALLLVVVGPTIYK